MIDKVMLEQMLREFFDLQYSEGLSERFVNLLSEDFNKVIVDFNSFVTRKNLQMDNNVNKVNFHEAAKKIMDEICGFKIQAIKIQHKMLIDTADKAKELAMRHKESAH